MTACDARPRQVLRTSDVAPAAPGASQPASVTCVADTPARGPSTWRVRRGDSLRSIARDVYGDERQWTEIARANPDRVTREGVVRAGVELTIPWEAR